MALQVGAFGRAASRAILTSLALRRARRIIPILGADIERDQSMPAVRLKAVPKIFRPLSVRPQTRDLARRSDRRDQASKERGRRR